MDINTHLIKDSNKNFKGWSKLTIHIGIFITLILLKESIKIKNYLFLIIAILKLRSHLNILFFDKEEWYITFMLKLYYALFAPATANLSA